MVITTCNIYVSFVIKRRIAVDYRNESLNRKIRDGQLQKIPVMLIVGPQDEADEVVSVRTQKGEEKVKLSDLVEFFSNFK